MSERYAVQLGLTHLATLLSNLDSAPPNLVHLAVMLDDSEANRLELDVERLEDEREELTDRIEEPGEGFGRQNNLEELHEAIVEELTELRTPIKRIKDGADDSFNDYMTSIFDHLEYKNTEQIWI